MHTLPIKPRSGSVEHQPRPPASVARRLRRLLIVIHRNCRFMIQAPALTIWQGNPGWGRCYRSRPPAAPAPGPPSLRGPVGTRRSCTERPPLDSRRCLSDSLLAPAAPAAPAPREGYQTMAVTLATHATHCAHCTSTRTFTTLTIPDSPCALLISS